MSKTIKILTPDNVEIEYNIASMGIRAAAAGIDLLIHGLVIGLVAFISWIILRNDWDIEKVLNLMTIFMYIFLFLNYFYYIVCDVFMKGQTFGKRFYRIRVIRANGQGMTISHILIRELFRATIDFLGIGFVVMLFSKNTRRVGDMVASTIVVEEEKSLLTYIDIPFQSNYQYILTSEERNLLQDYFARKDTMDEDDYNQLGIKCLNYFRQKGLIDGVVHDVNGILKGLLH